MGCSGAVSEEGGRAAMGIGKVFKLDVIDGIGVATFDVPGAPMNTWTGEAMEDFYELIDTLEKGSYLEGVIFVSGKPYNFHSGANLNFIEDFSSKEELGDGLDRFHRAFNRLQKLSIPSVAAISGHCLGGGYELALACTARIARESKTTVIGLPECLVGLFPGGGGTQRLPRLIGLPALELILTGKSLPADRAYEAGMIDRLVPAEGDLLQEAKLLIKEIIAGTASLKRPVHHFSQIDLVAGMAREKVLKATRGRELPGPMLAIKAIQDGVKLSLEEGLEVEKKYFIEVALSREARGSINTFFLKTETDKPLAMVPRDFKARPVKKAAVLGFGTMGRGIVIDILRHMRIPVVVKDLPESLEPGKIFIRKILQGMAEKKRLKAPVEDLMELLTVTPEYGDSFKDVDLVIEAVFEDPKVKAEVYKELCAFVSEDCIIASNTSTIPITRMAAAVTRPERLAGAHFFSPVWQMELLEVIKGEKTSQDTIFNLLCFAAAIKKRPVVCKDNPGFIVNALVLPYCLKMYDLLSQGVPIEDIDRAMVQFGFPVGPVKLLDEVGIDVQYKAFLAMDLEAPKTLERLIQDGRTGLKKSGKGIFLKDGSVDPGVLPLIEVKGEPVSMSVEEIQLALYQGIVEKGKDLLDSGVVDNPRIIDAAAIWGLGFPPDKGGPMRWADLMGLSQKLYQKNFY